MVHHDVLYLSDLAYPVPSLWMVVCLVFLPSFYSFFKMQPCETFLDMASSYFLPYTPCLTIFPDLVFSFFVGTTPSPAPTVFYCNHAFIYDLVIKYRAS